MLIFVTAGLIWFGRFIVTIPVSAIPDEEALAKKINLENEIEEKKLEVERNAKQNFQVPHSFDHFFMSAEHNLKCASVGIGSAWHQACCKPTLHDY